MNKFLIPLCGLVVATACSKPEAQAKPDANTEANAEAMTAPKAQAELADTIRSAEALLAAAPEGPCLASAADALFGADYAAAGAGFTFWSSEARVAYQSEGTDLAELWVRSNEKDVSFERWFLEDKRAIEYMSGDLRTLGRSATWADVSNPVPAKVFAQLSPGKTGKWRCLDARAYSGEVEGVRWEVVWLPALKLPAAFSHGSPERGAEQHELRSLRAGAEAKAFFDRRTELDRMDFADIGDNESDPFVRKVIEKGLVEHADHGGGGHGH